MSEVRFLSGARWKSRDIVPVGVSRFLFLVAPTGVEFDVFLVVVDLFFGKCVGSDLCPGGGYFDVDVVVDADTMVIGSPAPSAADVEAA